MKSEFPNKLARIASVLFLVASVIWVQYPFIFSEISPANILAIVASAITWVAVEIADWKNNPSHRVNVLNDDTKKLNDLIELIDSKQYYVLKKDEIGTYIDGDAYNGLRSLVEFFDCDIISFHNESIQKHYEEICVSSNEFLSDLWTLYTHHGDGRATWRSSDARWVNDEIYKEIQTEIYNLNKKADQIATDWETLIKTAQIELRGNSVGIRAYTL